MFIRALLNESVVGSLFGVAPMMCRVLYWTIIVFKSSSWHSF